MSLVCRHLYLLIVFTLISPGLFGRVLAERFAGVNGAAASAAESAEIKSPKTFVIRLTEKDLSRQINLWRLSQPSVDVLVEKLVTSGSRRVILPDMAGRDGWKFCQELAIGLKGRNVEVWFELFSEKSQDNIQKEVALFDELKSEKSKTDFVRRAAELMKVVGADGKPVCSGFFMPLVIGQTLPGGLLSGLSVESFRRFVSEIKISEDLSASLDTDQKRERFVMSTGLMPWLKWRSTKVAAFYGLLAANLNRETGQKIIYAAPSPSVNTAKDELSEIQKTAVSPLLAWREVGFEPEVWPASQHYKIILSETLSQPEVESDAVDHPDLTRAMKGRLEDGHWFGVNEVSGAGLTWFGRERYGYLQSVITAKLAQDQPMQMIVDYLALEGQLGQVKPLAEKYQSLEGQGVVPAGSGAMLQGVSARIYGGPNEWKLVIFNALPFRVQVCLHLPESIRDDAIRVIDPEITTITERVADSKKRLFNIPPNSWGRFEVNSEHATMLGISTEVPDEARDIVQTRYEELVDHKPMTGGASGESAGVLSSAERSRGRRLMAALQAYRERRLADFFRLSNGLTSDRGTKVSRSLEDNREKRRTIR